MENEKRVIRSSPTSFHTAEMSEIVLSETQRTKLVFEPMHVDNPKDHEKQLRGKLVFQKPKSTADGQATKLSRRDIHSGEYFSLDMDTTEVYNLARGLWDYYDVTSFKGSPLFPVDYVEDIPDTSVLQVLSERPEIVSILSQQNREVLSMAMRLQELQEIKTLIEDNLENEEEAFWQNLFQEHSWVLSQLFALPYMLFMDQPYVGGKGIGGKSGKFPDYLFQNGITENVAIIELKTPKTELVYDAAYREGVFALHKNLSGAIAQALVQRDTLYKEYAVTQMNSDVHFEANNVECIVIAGNVGKITNLKQRRSFELYRNELRNIRIVGFDELLKKVEIMIQLMTSEDGV